MQVVKCELWHLKKLMEQENFNAMKLYAKEESLVQAASSPDSYTAMLGDEVMLSAGVHQYWDGRGEAWAMFNNNCKKHFLTLHNIIKRYFDLTSYRRIEAAVEVDFEPGHRWVKALGFQLEANVLKSYTPDGKDCSLYAKIKKGVF
jgi:hypothetical protein